MTIVRHTHRVQIDSFGVRLGAAVVDYQDGAEDRIMQILLDARDVSDGSDELIAAIDDWPTEYHLSPLRSNLLRPLRVGPHDRVLEVGAGTGVLTRWLAERGAAITAVEGSQVRADATAVRCRGLDNVSVVAGTVADIPPDERFDLVIVVGVLEHTASMPNGPDDLLAGCVEHLAEGGSLVLAIENQLGIKYLLGYDEDHHATAWVGIEDYPNGGPRTWSRQVLRSMLSSYGLSDQRWLYPFPDYKLPVVILSDTAYSHPSSADLIDLFVRVPATTDAGRATFVVDARAAHRVMVEAGIGPDVANSFLVVASRDGSSADRVDHDPLAWYFGARRLRPWRRFRTITPSGDSSGTGSLRINTLTPPARSSAGWLSQRESDGAAVHVGTSLDRALDAALDRSDLKTAERLLRLWVSQLSVWNGSSGNGSPLSHPFSPGGDDVALAVDHLDVSPSNFVLTDEGLQYVDAEWWASGPVSRRLAVLRGLWYYAADYVVRSATTPWGPMTSVDLLATHLAHLAGCAAGLPDLEAFRAAEGTLQQLVTGRPQDATVSHLLAAGTRRPVDTIASSIPVGRLQWRLDFAHATIKSLESDLAHVRSLYRVACDQLRQAVPDAGGPPMPH